jgi:hypothetical protein
VTHEIVDLAIALAAAAPIAGLVVGVIWWFDRMGEGRTDRGDS